MATTKANDPTAPFRQITDEAVTHLNAVKDELDNAVLDLDALEKIGLDVTALREKVEWGYKAREIIMNRFGKKP